MDRLSRCWTSSCSMLKQSRYTGFLTDQLFWLQNKTAPHQAVLTVDYHGNQIAMFSFQFHDPCNGTALLSSQSHNNLPPFLIAEFQQFQSSLLSCRVHHLFLFSFLSSMVILLSTAWLSLRLLLQSQGPKHSDVALVCQDLAVLKERSKKVSEARDLLQRGLDIRAVSHAIMSLEFCYCDFHRGLGI